MSDTAKTFEDLEKALEQSQKQERVLIVLYTLGIEYEAKTISAERYAGRVIQELKELFKPETR